MPTSRLTSKGQVTLPKSIRELLDLEPGDLVDFRVDPAGGVTIVPGNQDVDSLRGILARPGRRPVSLQEMEAAIARRGGEPE